MKHGPASKRLLGHMWYANTRDQVPVLIASYIPPRTILFVRSVKWQGRCGSVHLADTLQLRCQAGSFSARPNSLRVGPMFVSGRNEALQVERWVWPFPLQVVVGHAPPSGNSMADQEFQTLLNDVCSLFERGVKKAQRLLVGGLNTDWNEHPFGDGEGRPKCDVVHHDWPTRDVK